MLLPHFLDRPFSHLELLPQLLILNRKQVRLLLSGFTLLLCLDLGHLHNLHLFFHSLYQLIFKLLELLLLLSLMELEHLLLLHDLLSLLLKGPITWYVELFLSMPLRLRVLGLYRMVRPYILEYLRRIERSELSGREHGRLILGDILGRLLGEREGSSLII